MQLPAGNRRPAEQGPVLGHTVRKAGVRSRTAVQEIPKANQIGCVWIIYQVTHDSLLHNDTTCACRPLGGSFQLAISLQTDSRGSHTLTHTLTHTIKGSSDVRRGLGPTEPQLQTSHCPRRSALSQSPFWQPRSHTRHSASLRCTSTGRPRDQTHALTHSRTSSVIGGGFSPTKRKKAEKRLKFAKSFGCCDRRSRSKNRLSPMPYRCC